MRGKKCSTGLKALAIFAVTLLVTSTWAATDRREKVLLNFYGNGAEPLAGLISDGAGNLYGTTYAGGANNAGTVFELTPDGSGGWTDTVLYSFCSQTDCTDGSGPTAGLILDAAGNLYGTAYSGGAYGGGTAFELSPNQDGGWTETTLHSFSFFYDHQDGFYPAAGLIFDAAGNLYGTTSYGGYYAYGTAFELTPEAGGGWREQVIHDFNLYGADGGYPEAGMIFDAAGNLYGTIYSGGVFELTPTVGGGWTVTLIHRFSCNGTDGCSPYGGVIFDAAGNLYGTTVYGGIYGRCNGGADRCGTVFELTPTAGGGWTETVLHDFGNGGDGADPHGGLILGTIYISP